jgi:hypothetical protein
MSLRAKKYFHFLHLKHNFFDNLFFLPSPFFISLIKEKVTKFVLFKSNSLLF